MVLALRKCPAGEVRQAWAGGVGPICHQAALLVRGSAYSQQHWTILRMWGLICMVCKAELYSSIFFQKAIVLVPCPPLCPAMSPMGLNPCPVLSDGHRCQLSHQPFSIAKEGLEAWWEGCWNGSWKIWVQILTRPLTSREVLGHSFPVLRPELVPVLNDDNSRLKQYSRK